MCVCWGLGGGGGVLCSTLLHAPMLVPWGLSSKISIPYGEVTTADLCPNLRPPPFRTTLVRGCLGGGAILDPGKAQVRQIHRPP